MQTSSEINFRSKHSNLNITGYIEIFHYICEQIDKFVFVSEERFLSIGSSLQKYLSRSRNLTHLASEAASSITDEILNKGIEQLNSLLKEFDYYIENTQKEIREDKQGLFVILPEVVSISDQLQGFNRIIKQLRMLGISTKIESARLGAEDQGFFVLAETVDKLSGLIHEKAKTILEKSVYLIKELKETSFKLEKLDKEQSEQSSVIKTNITYSSEAFNSKFDKKIRQVEKISNCSSGISGNINEIVTSIQFQDITRQRLEHTKSAFEDLIHKSNEVTESGDEQNYAEILGRIHDIIILELSQLKSSSDEYNSALEKITGSLRGVKRNVAGMLEETVELVGKNDKNEKNSMHNIIAELSEITKGLNKNIEIGSDLSLSINSVISVVEDLSKYVMEIEDIGTEIELIALNARVKAARAGKNGSALGVLSETIQRLSVEAKSQTESTSKILNSISVRSKDLKLNLEKGTYTKEGEHLISSTDKISILVQSLINLEGKTEKDITNLTKEVTELKEEIICAANELVVNGDATNFFNTVKKELENVISKISEDGNYNSELATNTKYLARNYTMEHERKIHKKIMQPYQFELDETESIQINRNDDSLGDNVELF